MLAKLSVDDALIKARSYAEKGEVVEAQKIYQAISDAFCKQAKDVQQGLTSLKKSRPIKVTENMLQEGIDQLSVLYNQGQFSAAVEKAEVLTKQYPEAFIFWNILGASAAKIDLLDKAIDAFNKAILLKPDCADAYNNIGNVLKRQGKLDEAIESYKQSISLKPDYADSYYNMGNALQDKGKMEEAIESYNKVLILNPDHALACNNMGNALKDQFKLDKAIEAYNKAISLKPDYAEAYSNMGVAVKIQGDLKRAIDVQKKCISLNPDHAEAHQNLCFTLLNSGKIREGLDEHEWRWKTVKGFSRQRNFLQSMWDGKTSLKNKKILLWCEQGIGDTMNWCSCLPFITSRAKHCIVECQEKLVPLLQRSFPNVEIKAEDRSLDSERQDFDLHLPMGSLYKHFIDEIMQNVKPDSYLVPDPERVKFWRKRLRSVGKGPYIGISWKSSVVSPYRLQHYPPITEWSAVLNVPDVTFINLQYTDYVADIAKVQDEFGVTVHNFEDIDQYNNIDEVAALCAALDMVVSTKIAPPFISSSVGTTTKIANWRQSSYNNILTNPVTSSYEMFERDTWEPWDNVFSLIAKNISKQCNRRFVSRDELCKG